VKINAALIVLLLGALPALCLFAPIPARADDAMSAAANNFYSLVVGQKLSGIGIPGAAARAKLAPLLTPRLNKQLADAATAQTRFMAKNKDSPPLIEGDIFSSLFEGPTAWKVGACSGDDKIARCSVSLTRQDPGQKPANWTDTLVLSNQGGWKVDDLAYDANFAFGNTGTLNDMLKMAQSEAQ
jgi:hypothetical protein